jgi:hypothetical protein
MATFYPLGNGEPLPPPYPASILWKFPAEYMAPLREACVRNDRRTVARIARALRHAGNRVAAWQSIHWAAWIGTKRNRPLSH